MRATAGSLMAGEAWRGGEKPAGCKPGDGALEGAGTRGDFDLLGGA